MLNLGIMTDRKVRKILRRRTVLQRTGLSYATIWRYERVDQFPHRIVLNENGNVGWFEDEIDAWIADRVRAAGKRPAHVAPARPLTKVALHNGGPPLKTQADAPPPAKRPRGRPRKYPLPGDRPAPPLAARADLHQ